MAAGKTKSGIEYDPQALDAIEERLWVDLWSSVPAEAAAEHGIERASFGPVKVTVVGELADVSMLNLVLGATAPGAVADGYLEAALAWARERGARPYVPLNPNQPSSSEAERLLRAAGFAPGYGWMRFVRDPHPPRFAAPEDVEVVELREPGQEPFAAIVAAAFELPAWCAELFANLPGRPGWRCYVAKVDGDAQGAGAMLVDGGIAALGLGATLEPARGRGCQLALLRQRIDDGAEAGARQLYVWTGERVPDRPSSSYRNILRAGFEEAYVRPNWRLEAARTQAVAAGR